MTTTRRRSATDVGPCELSDRDLPALIRRSTQPVVIEGYYGGWEDPWRALSAEAWPELLRERVIGAVVETGRNREFAVRNGLEVIPVVLVFLGGEVVARFSGRVRVEDVLDAIRSALHRGEALESDTLELEAVSAARGRRISVRSILRRRTSAASGRKLAHAG